jgi:putative acetyltransferase
VIREERLEDRDAIRAVNRAAFGGETEARLVDLLREAGEFIVSLVSLREDHVVGHVLFSRIWVETPGGRIAAASLAPMAVLPEWQRRGVGSELVRRGLELCGERGVPFVVVLGHPEYYPRFGFSAELARRLTSPYSSAGAAWMAVELRAGSLEGVNGRVVYPAAFEAGSE